MKSPDGMVFIYKPVRTRIDIESQELIMCKNCKHWKRVIHCGGEEIRSCELLDTEWGEPDGWCYLAEKKDDGTE